MDTYRKDVFRAAVVNQDYRSCRTYAMKHGLSPATANTVWNGGTHITIEKLLEIITPLGLTLAELFAPAPEEINGNGNHE